MMASGGMAARPVWKSWRAPIGALTGEAAVVYTNAAYKLLP